MVRFDWHHAATFFAQAKAEGGAGRPAPATAWLLQGTNFVTDAVACAKSPGRINSGTVSLVR